MKSCHLHNAVSTGLVDSLLESVHRDGRDVWSGVIVQTLNFDMMYIV